MTAMLCVSVLARGRHSYITCTRDFKVFWLRNTSPAPSQSFLFVPVRHNKQQCRKWLGNKAEALEWACKETRRKAKRKKGIALTSPAYGDADRSHRHLIVWVRALSVLICVGSPFPKLFFPPSLPYSKTRGTIARFVRFNRSIALSFA